MNWTHLGYVAACVLVPVAWGLLVVWASNWVEQRVKRSDKARRHDEEPTALAPLEYHI